MDFVNNDFDYQIAYKMHTCQLVCFYNTLSDFLIIKPWIHMIWSQKDMGFYCALGVDTLCQSNVSFIKTKSFWCFYVDFIGYLYPSCGMKLKRINGNFQNRVFRTHKLVTMAPILENRKLQSTLIPEKSLTSQT